MIDWLLAPIDVTRGHDLSGVAAWHGRIMVLAWAVLLPVGVIVARFFKITKRQNWPQVLDNKTWWIAHQSLQYAATLLMIGAVWLIWRPGSLGGAWHTWFGWVIVGICIIQILGGWLRGSKGGPTDPQPGGSLGGDHYAMTPRRRAFEATHKSVGYAALLLSIATILSGLWLVNAPRWMWLALGLWWLFLIGLWLHLQARGKAVDTY